MLTVCERSRLITRFLFWNVQRKPLELQVASLVTEWQADLVILAECRDDLPVLTVLNDLGLGLFSTPTRVGRDLRLFSRVAGAVHSMLDDVNGHLSVYRLVRRGRPETLVATVHYQSRRDWDRDDQDQHASGVAADIRQQERRRGHKRTVVVGDFNMNPFDRGVVGYNAFHAVMTREFAAKRERVVDAKPYDMFYNPMWRFFGDHTPGPAGTHWYRPAKPVVYGWNMYDQVLLRPDLMDQLSELKILDRIGGRGLICDGRPDVSVGSDHLPLYFSLDL